MNWYFTADLHFDHDNIRRHCKRPFASVEEMNEALIKRWNSRVAPGDTICVAGDFTMHHDFDTVRYRFIRYLQGNIIWVKGNHDHWMKESKVKYRHIYHKRIKNGPYIVVSHYPMRSWNMSHHGALNLHGHTHGMIEPYRNQLDVGVDSNDYYPVSIVEATEKIMQNNRTAPEADYYIRETE